MDLITLLTITLPLFSGLFAGLTWFIRGYIDNKNSDYNSHIEKKREYLTNHLNEQLTKFYWPFQFNLAKFKNLYDMYEHLKGGKSINSTPTDSDKLSINDIEMVILNMDEPDYRYKKRMKNDLDVDSLIIMSEYSLIVDDYETMMIETLNEILKLIEEKTSFGDVDNELYVQIIKLYSFIISTNIYYQKRLCSTHIKSMLNFSTGFPKNIYEMIEIRLEYLQETYNDIINNNKSNIIYGKNIDISTENKDMKHKKMSVFRSIRKSQKKRKTIISPNKLTS